ncbi:Zn-dependent hydrolase, glyoxylase [Hoeflea sp. IMCC20628]|uniref:MBL fold metallo-hydrolase n=1 Tax=Hoeflea sp. IMCC20628 TaxID=1620421 RepID=UPI00063AF710|nr:MBL fold metallo-hydrolase [Hoeflea sp. IMCC20628]AKI00196.1 Zn-dependent hydrolase, glyoxylase [Hoeflea sp. IMCC20628]
MIIHRTSRSRGPGSAEVTGFYDEDTGSIQYLVSDPQTGKGALIDVVMGFDPADASTDSNAAEQVVDFAKSAGIDIVWILDTHPHADHLMASSWLKQRLGAPNAIGEKTVEIAELWRKLYHMPEAFNPRRDFDRLFAAGDEFHIGSLPVRVMLTPGHTLGSVSYIVGTDAAFVNDTFMQPDVGTSRADFPGGSAGELYDSLQAILSLDDETRLFVGHDYGTDERSDPEWESTVSQQRRENTHIAGDTSKDAYIKLREQRDQTLGLPDRMLHVLQMNLRAGRSPEPESDGKRYLKIPLNRFEKETS